MLGKGTTKRHTRASTTLPPNKRREPPTAKITVKPSGAKERKYMVRSRPSVRQFLKNPANSAVFHGTSCGFCSWHVSSASAQLRKTSAMVSNILAKIKTAVRDPEGEPAIISLTVR